LRWQKSEHLLSQKQEDGNPLRVHIEVIERKTKKPHKYLSGRRPLNPKAMYLWAWWLEMKAEAGGQSITGRVMQDWQWLTGSRINMLERKVIAALEAQWRNPPEHAEDD
jgi:hypothetical protein